jgi:hypothetical protein
MVSIMESDFTAQQALAEAERGAVAAWIDYPSTSWWYFPGMGAWATAWVLVLTELRGLWLVPAELALVAVGAGFLGWYRRVRGAWPKITNSPDEFRHAIRGYLAGVVGLGLAISLLAVVAGAIVAAPVAFVGVTGGLLWYEKAYERAATQTRQRVEGRA